MYNAGIIILAAGSASRFGKAKQLLNYNGKTLLQHVIDEAVSADAKYVVVVTGANADEMSKQINESNVSSVYNDHWQDGIASSIVTGVQKLTALCNNIEKIIIAVCDQPFVSANLFICLDKTQQEGGKHIVASAYDGTIGTPALFTKKYLNALLSLRGDEGAKKLLLLNTEDLATVGFTNGGIDIDTEEDYVALCRFSSE